MSSITTILFLGGWFPFIDILPFNLIPESINFGLKTMIFITLFVIVRGTLPRYRYDQLMRLGWKIFLPLALALLLFFATLLISFNSSVELLR
jgi:NADH-quinone oxidoreductase subunit H